MATHDANQRRFLEIQAFLNRHCQGLSRLDEDFDVRNNETIWSLTFDWTGSDGQPFRHHCTVRERDVREAKSYHECSDYEAFIRCLKENNPRVEHLVEQYYDAPREPLPEPDPYEPRRRIVVRRQVTSEPTRSVKLD